MTALLLPFLLFFLMNHRHLFLLLLLLLPSLNINPRPFLFCLPLRSPGLTLHVALEVCTVADNMCTTAAFTIVSFRRNDHNNNYNTICRGKQQKQTLHLALSNSDLRSSNWPFICVRSSSKVAFNIMRALHGFGETLGLAPASAPSQSLHQPPTNLLPLLLVTT
jgi:hypothetical protein